MRIQLLKPVKLTLRKPLRNDRYFLKLVNGLNVSRRWMSYKRGFGKLPDALIDEWYEPVNIPSPEDIRYLVAEHIPPHVRYEEREAMLRGASLAIECLERHIEKS